VEYVAAPESSASCPSRLVAGVMSSRSRIIRFVLTGRLLDLEEKGEQTAIRIPGSHGADNPFRDHLCISSHDDPNETTIRRLCSR